MRTDVISFILGSEKRKKIVKTLFEYPKREWSCSSMEDVTGTSHASVFRTLQGLKEFGVLKSVKINKKDILYELVDSPIVKEIKRVMDIEKIAVRKIVKKFLNRIKSKEIYSVVLYGSSIKGGLKAESDIDVLVILNKQNRILERKILDVAGTLSSKVNKTIAVVVMSKQELRKERGSEFIKSVKKDNEVVYGKKPF